MILSVQSIHTIERAALSPEALYDRVEALAEDIASIHPHLAGWYDFPASQDDRVVPFADRSAIVGRMAEQAAKDKAEYRALEEAGGANLSLTTASTDREWRQPGVVTLDYKPALGQARFTIDLPEPVFGEELERVMREALVAMVQRFSSSFAKTDVKARGADRQPVLYQLDKRLYQHRDFIGWMGFVPVDLPHAQIRDAYETIPVPGKGTVVVAVPGVFDPTDGGHVEKVHRVEMDLASYDLLPVLDPNLR